MIEIYLSPPNFKFSSCCNSATDCSISIKFGKEFHQMTSDVLQTFKVKGSKVKVTACGNVGENVLNHQ